MCNKEISLISNLCISFRTSVPLHILIYDQSDRTSSPTTRNPKPEINVKKFSKQNHLKTERGGILLWAQLGKTNTT